LHYRFKARRTMNTMKTTSAALYLAAACISVAAIPSVLQHKTKIAQLEQVSRSFVATDLNGVTFKIMSQYRQGTTTGMAPECPQNMRIVEGEALITNDGVLSLNYDRLKLWGTRDSDPPEPVHTCNVTGLGHIELAESQLLRGGDDLDELRDSFDISNVFDNVTPEDIAAGAQTDEIHRLHQSVWLALQGKQYYTGKVDYKFGDKEPQKELLGIICTDKKWFSRGELFLFIDEAKDVQIFVKTAAKTTEGINLIGNRRYAVVTTADSTCIYRVDADKDAGHNSDHTQDGSSEISENVVKPPTICAAGCTCQCSG
jgi:hypothetical protein